MEAQEYFESLLGQGYESADAEKYTQEHYPEFSQVVTETAAMPAPPAAAPIPQMMPAPGAMPAAPVPGLTGMPLNLPAGTVLQVKQPSALWRILNGISGIILAVIVIWLSSEIKSDYDLAAAFFDAFGMDVTDDLESTISLISLMLMLVMIVGLGLFVVSIIQFVNTPWAAKALLGTNAVLMLLLLITGYLEYSLFSELDEEMSLFETNGLVMSYCTGICFATFGLFAFLGRSKGPSVELQM